MASQSEPFIAKSKNMTLNTSKRTGKNLSLKPWVLNKALVGICLALPLLLGGCGPYSFTGAALSSKVKTVTVENFPNNADLIVPTLSQNFTEKLKKKFLRDTRLEVVRQGGDLVFSGSIVKYDVSPEVIQKSRQNNLSKLTIAVRTTYLNKVNPDQNFERKFSESETFKSSKNLDQIEDQKIDEITTKIIEKIFSKSVNNW